MPGGGGNKFPTEGYEQRISAAIIAHPQLMRTIAGAPFAMTIEPTKEELEHHVQG